MANLKKPNKALARKGVPPLEAEASNNITELDNSKIQENPKLQAPRSVKEEIKPLNFKVPNSFRKRFKNYAVNNDITMSELLVTCFEHYTENSR